jgi:hypothetical protein
VGVTRPDAAAAAEPPEDGLDATRRPEPRGPFDGRAGRWFLAAAVAAVLAGLVLRFVSASHLWLDEALTSNIASRPLGDLTDLLRRDGAPPLYYVLLHVWLDVFGDSDTATRALSGVLGVGAVALAWPAGAALGGEDPDRRRWTAVSSVLVIATSVYAIRYSNENRMYMLEVVLVLAGYLALRAALDRPTIGRLAGVAAVVAALLYTQYWALYLVAVVGGGLLLVAWRGDGSARDRRGAARRALVALAVGCVAFVPWLPHFAYQAGHTGTPWADPTVPPTGFDVALTDFAGGEHADAVLVRIALVLLAALGLFGVATGRWHADLDLRTRRGVRWEWGAWVGALTLGLTLSYLAASAFQSRYAAIVYPLFVLTVAYGVVVLGNRPARYAMLAFVVLLGLVGGVRQAGEDRTQGGAVSSAINARARPGDVVAFCPDQLGPSGERDLRRGLDVGSFPGFRRADLVDWVDYEERNQAADPDAFARDVLARAGPDHAVFYAYAPGYRTFGDKCERIAAVLASARADARTLVPIDDEIFEPETLVRFGP